MSKGVSKGVTAKDIALAIIGRIGTAGGTGHAIEFGGSAIRSLSMEGRMKCQATWRSKLGRAWVLSRSMTLRSTISRDAHLRPLVRSGIPLLPHGVRCTVTKVLGLTACSILSAADILPQVTWGTSPEMVVAIDGKVPDPAKEKRSGEA